MPSLIEIQLDVLLARNAAGRLIATRDPERRPAPRLFMARAADGNVWGVRQDVDAAVAAELDRLCAAEPPLAAPGPRARPSSAERARELLAPVSLEWRGPAYVLPAELPADERARELTSASPPEWLEPFSWLRDRLDEYAPVAIALQDGEPAALCHSPRGMTDHAAEAGVLTLEPLRGRGLATAAVACWARAVQQRGRLALYSTSWDNLASQAVARRLSARLYGENWHLT